MEEKKKLPVRSIGAAAVGMIIAWAVAVYRGLALGQAPVLMARCLCDGFFVAGLLLGGLGVLVWVSSIGFFDMLGYGVHSLLVLFSLLKKPSEHESFYDYKMEKEAKRGKPVYDLMIVGGAYIALSVICLVLYYKLPA